MPRNQHTPKKPAKRTTRADAANPFLKPWRTPFGLPPFDRIKPQHVLPAFKAALAENRAEIKAIADNGAAPSFANTIHALEKSGQLLTRVCNVFFNLSGAHTNEALQAAEREIAPQLAAHESAIHLNQRLFKRIDDLFSRRDRIKLNAEQARVLERTHTAFVRAGARLGAKAKKRVGDIQQRLATLVTQFSQNVLADEQSWHLWLEKDSDLAGLPATLVADAGRNAAALGRPGSHAITLARSSVESFLQHSARRDLREEAFMAWIKRGEATAKTDNKSIAAEVIALRAEMAALLGYQSYAHYSLDDTMAKTPEAVQSLLGQVWPRALKKSAEECAMLEKLAHKEGGNFSIAPWDWRYYAEKVRKARYDLDEADIRPYLQLDKIIEAAFDTAARLFGLSFTELPDAPRYHPDVRVWEVTGRDGRHVGLFLGDYFARPSKRSGAWMSNYRSQHRLKGEVRPIIVNVMNFAAPGEGQPALLSFDDARTLFHEFGHGLHGLLSDVTYPSIAGTNVPRDFVELPSQLYEHWLSCPEVLGKFAVHYKTGKAMPGALIDKIAKARTFNQGFATVEFTASALVDMELHARSAGEKTADLARFEAETLERLGMPQAIVMRHRIPHFLHIMGGYAAGYYSYLWSEVMDADAFSAFEEAGGVFDKPTARRLYEYIYSAGNLRDPEEAYRAFRGRSPKIDGLMKKRGFAA